MISSGKSAGAAIGLLEDPERHSSLSKPEVLEILRLKPGMTVAEIGAARGDLCLSISQAVGSTGHVFAVEAIPEMLPGLRQSSQGQANIHLVAEPYHETALAGESCDRVVMVNLWAGLRDPLATLREVARVLRKDGRLVLIEWRPDAAFPPGPPPDKRTEFRAIVQCLERHTWDLHGNGAASPYSYFLEVAITDESVQS
jgi:ubiquinone/menaquinone biosynthesis C-methylase UbiE